MNNKSNTNEEDVLDLLFSEFSKRFEHEENRKNILENKFNFFMTFYGILISGLLIMVTLRMEYYFSSLVMNVSLLANIGLIIYLMIWIAYLFNIIQLQEYREPVNPRDFYNEFSDGNISTVKLQLLSNYIDALETNRNLNDRKGKVLKRARLHLWIQICIISVLILTNILSFIVF